MAKKIIEVLGLEIVIEQVDNEDYISLTDIAKQTERKPADSISDWLRNSATLLFIQTWERLHNPNFKVGQMQDFRILATDNRKAISPQRLISETNAIGIVSKSGRYGGTYAHSDIATNFCNWLSPEFQVYFIKEFKRLKEEEAARLGQSWDIQRLLTKANFHIQSASIRDNIVPLMQQNTKVESFYHASEVDMLNMIIWGMTAKEWKLANPSKKGNIRDHATKLELVILNNLQAINAVLIDDGMAKKARADKLLKIATSHMQVLLNSEPIKKLEIL